MLYLTRYLHRHQILHETPHQLCMVSVSTQTETTGPILEFYNDSNSEILFKEYYEDMVVETKRNIGMEDFNERAILNDETIFVSMNQLKPLLRHCMSCCSPAKIRRSIDHRAYISLSF